MTNSVAKYSALLSVTEVGIGSLVHALHLPLAGHCLSLNQGLILTWAIRSDNSIHPAKIATGISQISALMKSLSPAGKKLTPMLAISAQGLLYSMGVLVFGANLLGVMIGMLLLSLWGFIQPVLVAYLIYGESFFSGILKLWETLSQSLGINPAIGIKILVFIVSTKLLAALWIGVLGWHSSLAFEKRYVKYLQSLNPKSVVPKKNLTPLKGAVRDLLHPYFLISIAMSALFFSLSESHGAKEIWIYIARPLAVAFILFWLVRLYLARPKTTSYK
jgi:hypothetical protein